MSSLSIPKPRRVKAAILPHPCHLHNRRQSHGTPDKVQGPYTALSRGPETELGIYPPAVSQG